MSRLFAAEIDDDDAAWLRGQSIPNGAEVVDVDEVAFMGRSYVAQRSGLYIPETFEETKERLLSEKQREAQLEERRPIGIDLFCGAGGFTLGMHEGGFDVLAAAEWGPEAAATYLLNLGHPACRIHHLDDDARSRWERFEKARARRAKKSGTVEHFVESDRGKGWIGSGYLASRSEEERDRGCRELFFGDIAKLDGARVLEALGTDEIACVFGGPPCQGMSTASKNRCLEDPRNGMLFHFMRLVSEIKPRTFIMENVPQILTIGRGAIFEAIADHANGAGYDVVAQKLCAANYGVPQFRTRALIVGTEHGLTTSFAFPMPTTWALGRHVNGRENWSFYDELGKDVGMRRGKKARFDGRGFQAPEEEGPDQCEMFA